MIKIYESVTVRNNMSLRLKYGQATVKFDFERGNVAKGLRAKYITNDEFRQRVLDSSSSLNNLYRLAKCIPESSDDAAKVSEEAALKQKAQEAAQEAYKAVMASNSAAAATETPAATTETPAAAEAEETAAEETATTTGKGTQMKDMQFQDVAEVIVYVMENYGEQVENLEAATKLLRKHKINPVIK